MAKVLLNSLSLGESWGVIKVAQVWQDSEKYGSLGGQATYGLVCECGGELEFTEREWREKGGKRRVKDCGCGLADERGCVVNKFIGLPVGTMQEVNRWAREHGVSANKAIGRLVEIGLRADLAGWED